MKPSVHHDHATGFLSYRYALHNLVLKDFRVRYRNMSLGFMWSILNPLVMLGVLVFVFTFIVNRGGGEFFPIELLIGIIVYNFFSLCISAATGSIIGNASIVKKVIFPRQIIPISVVLSQVIHLMIQLLLLGLFLLIFRVPLSITYLWLPIVIIVEMIFIMGIALITASLNVFFRDVQYLVLSGLTIMFWFTPIFYKLSDAHTQLAEKDISWVYFVYVLNPLAGCVNGIRRAILYQQPPDAIAFGSAIAIALLCFCVGIFTFKLLEKNFADRI